jgi:DNA-binding LacI/PurR family transcriptional regulator
MRKKVTSHDVAERAGVSRVTVSMILNRASGSSFSEATRQRVLAAAEDLGYRPNVAGRMLVSGMTETIGLVVCHAELLRFDGFIPQVLQAITKVNQRHGYRVLLDVVEGNVRPDAYASMVHSRQIDGLIVIDPATDDPQLHRLIDEGFPLVLLGSVRHAGEHSVNFPTRRAIGMEIDHLVRLGHRSLAYITYSPAGFVATDSRLAAYFSALAKHGLPQDERWIAYGAFSAESGYLATREVLDRGGPRPTVVLAGNDTIALGVIAAIAEAGLRVPHDIAVVGFDDLPTAPFMQPPLTTIHNPAAQQGELAAEMLVKLLAHEPVETPRIRVPVNLVVRASCGNDLEPEERHWGS